MLLNCDTLEHTYVPLDLGDCSLVIINTNKPRGLADSKYNERRAESERALELLRQEIPDLKCLCAITPEDFHARKHLFKDDPIAFKRAQHAVEENARTFESVEVLKAGDLKRFGELLYASHDSLRDLYEVTGEHLDALYDAAKAHAATVGGRMTGAGFGGCTVNIVKTAGVESFIEFVSQEYTKRCGIVPSFYISKAGRGAGELTREDAAAVCEL